MNNNQYNSTAHEVWRSVRLHKTPVYREASRASLCLMCIGESVSVAVVLAQEDNY